MYTCYIYRVYIYIYYVCNETMQMRFPSAFTSPDSRSRSTTAGLPIKPSELRSGVNGVFRK